MFVIITWVTVAMNIILNKLPLCKINENAVKHMSTVIDFTLLTFYATKYRLNTKVE